RYFCGSRSTAPTSLAPIPCRVAEQLQEATREAEESQSELRAKRPFSQDQGEYEELFYATPQKVPVAKDPAPQSPLIYAQPTY
ncbi:MAG: hypothetical protein VCB77_02180, partial [Alphaproteobacteria bacterium]